MRLVALCLGVLSIAGTACLGPTPSQNSCESLGGICVAAGGACGGTLPEACEQSDQVCCEVTVSADGGSTPVTADAGKD